MAQTQESPNGETPKIPETITEAIKKAIAFTYRTKKSYGWKNGKIVSYKDSDIKVILELSVGEHKFSDENESRKFFEPYEKALSAVSGFKSEDLASMKISIKITVESPDKAQDINIETVIPVYYTKNCYKCGVNDKRDFAIAFSYLKKVNANNVLSDHEKVVFGYDWGYKGRLHSVGIMFIPPTVISEIQSKFNETLKTVLETETEEIDDVSSTAGVEPQPVASSTAPTAVSDAEIELEVEPILQQPTQPQQATQPPPRAELVDLYLLGFELPSGSLATFEDKYDTSGDEIREVKRIEKKVFSEIEHTRKKFYSETNRVFHNVLFGWIAVTPQALQFAEYWNNRFRSVLEALATALENKARSTSNTEERQIYEAMASKLKARAQRQFVVVQKIYMDTSAAKMLIEDITSQLNREIEELKKKIDDAEKEKKKKTVARLNYELNILMAKYQLFKKKLDEIQP